MYPSFRFHVMSLTAVFLALSVGLLIGGLFLSRTPNEIQERLIRSIKRDLETINTENAKNRQLVERLRAVLREVQPRLANPKMSTRRVAVIQTGDDADALSEVLSLLRNSGTDPVVIVSVTDRWMKLKDSDRVRISNALRKVSPKLPEGSDALIKSLANSICLPEFQPALDTLHRDGLIRIANQTNTLANCVIVVGGSSRYGGDRPIELDRPLLRQWKSIGLPVAGVEQSTAYVSHIPVFRESGIGCIDAIDTAIGAICFTWLFDAPPAVYGIGSMADRLLPPQLESAP